MRTLNRAALVVRPREPYLKWAASIDDEAAEAAIPLRARVSVYLVAEDPRGEEESAPLENYFEEIFEHELEAWYTDENRWPPVRDMVTFLEWFDVSRESIVLDLESYKLQTEDW